MALKYEEVSEFIRNNGDVTAYTTSGWATPLRDNEPDAVGMAELWADVFEFSGNEYSRVQFEQLVKRKNKEQLTRMR